MNTSRKPCDRLLAHKNKLIVKKYKLLCENKFKAKGSATLTVRLTMQLRAVVTDLPTEQVSTTGLSKDMPCVIMFIK